MFSFKCPTFISILFDFEYSKDVSDFFNASQLVRNWLNWFAVSYHFGTVPPHADQL